MNSCVATKSICIFFLFPNDAFFIRFYISLFIVFFSVSTIFCSFYNIITVHAQIIKISFQ